MKFLYMQLPVDCFCQLLYAVPDTSAVNSNQQTLSSSMTRFCTDREDEEVDLVQ